VQDVSLEQLASRCLREREEVLTESFILTVDDSINFWLVERATKSMSGCLDGCYLYNAELRAPPWEFAVLL
jgi:hypothetical protein